MEKMVIMITPEISAQNKSLDQILTMLAKHRHSDLISALPQLVRKVSSGLAGKW